jgi:hypothetical protein
MININRTLIGLLATILTLAIRANAQFPEPLKRCYIESLAGQQYMVRDANGAVVGNTDKTDQVWVLVPEDPNKVDIDIRTNVYIRFNGTGEFLLLKSAAMDTPVSLGPIETKQLWRLIPTARPGYFKLKMTAPGVDCFIGAEALPNHHIWSIGSNQPDGQSFRFIPAE